ncbi:MAG: patatin-like phospholipase family protein [Simkaniaceae bacterium]|nr:patatin-like phospholipase family protein [Simkaniaceae bacterium]
MRKLAIFISGGATKIAFLAGVIYTFLQRIQKKPIQVTEYVGISSGFILAVFFAMGKYSTVLKYMPIYTLKMIFGVDPDSRKGIFIIAKNFILKKKLALLEYKGLAKILKHEITQEDLDAYKKSDMPDCWGGVVDIETLEELYYSVKKIEKVEDLHKLILASCSIPFMSPYQEVFNRKLYDGGLRAHNGAGWALDNLNDFDYVLSVYSRSDDWADYKSKLENKWGWLFGRVNTALTLDMSFEDSAKAKRKAEHKGVKMYEIFAPKRLQSKTFEASKEGNLEMMNKGKRQAQIINLKQFLDLS